MALTAALGSLLLPWAPTATAEEACLIEDGNTTLCYKEESYKDGTCAEQNGGSEYDNTELVLHNDDTDTTVSVSGAAWCYDYGDFGSYGNGVFVYADTPIGIVMVWWMEDSFYNEFGEATLCTITVYDGVLTEEYLFADCPVGPPDPGWGHLVPDEPPNPGG